MPRSSLHGGTNWLLVGKSSYLACAHYIVPSRMYWHVFVEYDSEPPFLPRRHSPPFRFSGGNRVQMASSLAYAPTGASAVLLAYGDGDTSARMVFVSMEDVDRMLSTSSHGNSNGNKTHTVTEVSLPCRLIGKSDLFAVHVGCSQ